MAESTLSLGYPELLRAVGDYLGYGLDTSAYDADQTARADDIVQAGLRNFYFPPPLRPNAPAWRWTFLRPAATLATAVGQSVYDLPDDFGGMTGPLLYDPADDETTTVHVIAIEQVVALRQNDYSDGVLQYAAVRPKASTGVTGQRWEIVFERGADAIYTLHYRYSRLVSKLTAAAPYPWGGMPHAETLKASCLAEAEERMNNASGLKRALFLEKLAASIWNDAATGASDTLGLSTDAEEFPGRAIVTQQFELDGVVYDSQP